MKVLCLFSLLLLQDPNAGPANDSQQTAFLRTADEAAALEVIGPAARDALYLSAKLTAADRAELLKFADPASGAGAAITMLVNSENYEGDKAEAIAILVRDLRLSPAAYAALEKDAAVRAKLFAVRGLVEMIRQDFPGIRRDPDSTTAYSWR